VFSDCRHVNKREVDSFPVDLDKLSRGPRQNQLFLLGAKLMKDLFTNSEHRRMKFRHDTLTVQCIVPRLSKAIIDEIDIVLGEYYGFSKEELDFIIDYDAKHRLGSGG